MTKIRKTDATTVVVAFPRDYAEVDPPWYVAAFAAWATAAERAGVHFDEKAFAYDTCLGGAVDPDRTAAAVRVGEKWYALARVEDTVRLVPADDGA